MDTSAEQPSDMKAARSALIVERLVVERGGRPVIADLSFEVAGGEVLLLTGPNGAGKTTVLRAIAGLLAPAAGAVRVTGPMKDVPLMEQAHYIGHRDAVRPTLTVAENAQFWARFLRGHEDRVGAALDRLGLGALAAVPAAYLSAGQRRRLGLVRLLAADRHVWLLDEPTASLDATSSVTLAEIVAAHTARGGLALIATHQPIDVPRARQLRLGVGSAGLS